MLRSRSRRAAICSAAAALTFAQGCFVYRPAALPLPAGSEVRVRGARLELYDGGRLHAGPAECRAERLDGKLLDAKGDTLTLTIAPVGGMAGYSPRRLCSRLTTATLVAAPESTSVFARKFSPMRTTGAVVGTAVFVAAVAAAVIISGLEHADASYRPAQ
ncbi:MAG: hypothetical protein HOQ11_01550 [Gemmatimonadaceae bacterium]|nr:hypothetical protein [Gemmatimonadaceae bacterium]NUQ93815.1 hypothetical protein [Gemmatimonadaceae bacterium]NUR19231.1 hypothetical protein [Gemmatimonadaceae bacterium]NUS96074.1 hypothetical protein [Gemmatimonadaceae bacterium]